MSIMDLDMSGIMDQIMYAGLVVGAVFQLVCIGAAVWMPGQESDHRDSGDTNSSDDDVSVEGSSFNRNLYGPSGHVRRGRNERKKRR
jgi:uncharacterized membrane protein YagU involved in acid resistance